MFIIKPLTTAVDINSGASNVSSSKLVSVLNPGAGAVKITSTPHGDSNYSSASEVYVGAGERIVIKKESDQTLQADGSGSVWASGVAFQA